MQGDGEDAHHQYVLRYRRAHVCDDHNPPHIHVEYQGHKAVYSLDGELLSGELPSRQHRMFVGWAALHEDELRASWDIAHNGEQPYPIDPLR